MVEALEKAARTSRRVLGKSGFNNSERTVSGPTAHPPKQPQPCCPECDSQAVWLDGIRKTDDGDVQRYLCQQCGYRFSDPHRKLNNTIERRSTKELCSTNERTPKRRICAILQEAKNLTTSATKTIVASVEKQEVKGNLTLYMVKAQQRGHSDATIEHNVESIVWLAARTDLTDPVKVWHRIDDQKTWALGTKQHAASAYKNYAKIMKLPLPEELNFNKWVLSGRLPGYIPTENEIMALIASYNPRGATFLQLLYECGLRSGEAWRLKWENFDFEKKILTLNAENVEKKGVPRQFRISDKLVAMLTMLKQKRPTNPYVWDNGLKSLDSFRCNFVGKRKQLARKLQNPNLLKIKLHTFRHFYACKLYHSTKDILLVKSRLGHRNIQNTMVYTQLVEWDQPDQWIVRRPQTSKEEDELVEAGFEYVRFDDKLGVPIYRKQK